MQNHVLEVENLETSIKIKNQLYPAVEDISFNIEKGKVLGIVGESGCGKSILNKSLIQLLPKKFVQLTNGVVKFDGRRIDNITEDEMRQIRGKDMGMIFQEPMTALNPVYTIGNQIIEVLLEHKKISKKVAQDKAISLLKEVGIPNAEAVMKRYPHELSGGMRQRVVIAIAIACKPKLLIADEPTTALDVTIQAQILELLKKIQHETGMSIILITHDLSVVSEFCDDVMVIYAGQIIEYGTLKEIIESPLHPYTKKLLASIPRLDSIEKRLETISGIVPSLTEFAQKGCRFHNRCEFVQPICKDNVIENVMEPHLVKCCLYQNEKGCGHE